MIDKLVQSFGEGLSKSVVSNVAHRFEVAADRQIHRVKRKVILFAMKITFLVLALVTLVCGFVLLGAKYVGLEWMFIGIGAILLLGFLLS